MSDVYPPNAQGAVSMTAATAPGKADAGPSPAAPRHRIEFIDLFRGLAASLVVVQHIADHLIFNNFAASPILRAIFVQTVDLGRFGVALFFMISGYVIPFSLRGPRPARHFIIGRFFRLYPAYWASLIAAVAVYGLWLARPTGMSDILLNATMIEMAFGRQPLVGPYWTLIIELFFYAACLVLFLGGRLFDWVAAVGCWAVLMAAAIALTLLSLKTGRYGPVNLIVNVALMFYGLIGRHLDRDGGAQLSRVFLILTIATLILVPALLYLAPDRNNRMFTPTSFATGYVAALLVFQWRPTIGRDWFSRTLAWIGKISFSLYLFHDIVLSFLAALLPGTPSLAEKTAFWASTALISMIVSAIAFHLVERPAMRLGHRLIRQRDVAA